MKNFLAAAAIAAILSVGVLPRPVRSQVACIPASNIQCSLNLSIVFQPGNVTIEVPTDTLTIPANSLIDGATLTIDIPINNTGFFNVVNGQIAITNLPSYITIAPPPAFTIPAGGNQTIQLTALVGTVPTTATTETSNVAITVDGDIAGSNTSFSF